MTAEEITKAIAEALKVLREAKKGYGKILDMPLPIWRFLDNAEQHIQKEIVDMIQPGGIDQ